MSSDLVPSGGDNPLVPVNIQTSAIIPKVPKIDEPEDVLMLPAPSSDTVVVPSKSVKTKSKVTEILSEPELVAVKGNDKVQRCRRCNTFVKVGKEHSKADCDARLTHKAHKRPSNRPKRFRLTPKRKKILDVYIKDAASYREVAKNVKRLERWVAKKEGNLSKSTKKMFGDLLASFYRTPKCKDIMFRKLGLSQ